MRPLFLLALLLVPNQSWARDTAIVNAQLLDNTHDAELVTILIRDGLIEDVAADSHIPADADIIDAAGRPVTQALSAAATQLGLVNLGDATDTDDRAATVPSLGAAFEVGRAVDPNALTIQNARAQGITAALIFPEGGETPFSGTAAWLELDPAADLIMKPSAAIFARVDGQAGGGSRGAAWARIRLALDMARSGTSADVLRADPILSPANIAALQTLFEHRVKLAILADRESDIKQAIELSRDYEIGVVVVGGAEAWRLAKELSRSNVGIVLDPLDELPVSYDKIGARRDNAALLNEAGVPIALMVSGQGIYLSWNVGNALRQGAGLAAAHGLPRSAAIEAITVGPKRIWSRDEVKGLTKGARADLVVWDGDPLEPSSAPVHVIFGGREYSQLTRQMLLRDRYHPGRVERASSPATPGAQQRPKH